MSSADRPSLPPVSSSNGHSPLPVEALHDILGGLLREREELRSNGADRATLEQNRCSIVQAQWELSRALIARYHAGPGLQPA